MSKNLRLGAASIAFSQPLYIESAASIVSQKEADGPLGDLFDLICEDPMFGCDTWESAESTLQKETATQAISKAGLSSEDIHLMFAGDLLAQTSATCFGSAGLGIPFYGLYGACSTIGEALSLGSLALTAGFGTRVLCATSSHFASAEKEFRFPLGYGNQRPFSATWTVTGSGACILSTSPPGEKAPLRSGKGCAAITGLTAGRVMDYGLRDSMNMGGCMAPAACDTIARSFSDFGRTPSDYDAVFTGDLGIIGQKILLDLLKELRDKMNTSIILITHDLGVIAKMCDRVLVMYGGKVAEKGTVDEIFYETAHPYTAGLIKSIATLDTSKNQKLVPIDGTPPDLFAPPKGCPFAARCEFAMKVCYEEQPELHSFSDEHTCACWLQHEYAPKVDIMKGLTEAQKQEEEENVAALPEEKRRGHHGKTN